ncbi:MAG: ADP-glyceromanno-heptose 6-epimerase [Verrucomicrobiota bacterium]
MADTIGRVLVTGGAGFIGSALVWALNRRGVADILVSDFPGDAAKDRNLRPLKFADCVDAARFRAKLRVNPDAFGRFDTVFHLGACSSTTERDVAYLTDNNVNVTRELAEWSLARGARFIYASSAATYGDGAQGMDDRDEDLAKLKPLNPYGWSKQQFDLLAQREGWLGRIVGLKYFNVFGPNEDHKGDMRSLCHKAFHQVRREGRITLFKSHRPDFADGEQKRDFLYVKDAVEMTLHFATIARAAGGLYNLGSGVASSWNEVARALFAALGREPRIAYVDMPPAIRDQYQYYTRADIAKLRATGYDRPATPLSDAIADYVRKHLLADKRLGE